MIHEVTEAEVEATLEGATACGLFGAEELPVLRAQLEATLAGTAEREGFWLADFDAAGAAQGVAFCAAELMTDRVWNLLFIGVRTELQDRGLGSELLREVEARLRGRGQRMLVIETTNGPEFAGTRAFYIKHDYEEQGTVRDFYADGAHKIILRKRL